MTDQPQSWHMDMKALMALAAEQGASDLHLKAGRPPILRADGAIRYTDLATLSAQEILELARQVMDDRVWRQYQDAGSVDFSVPLEGGDRFRVNVYRQRGVASVAARRVMRQMHTFNELHLPVATMEHLCASPRGLIVFAGTTGTGKSTSIAACLETINRTRACHIVTLEDPIEYLFEDDQAFINQREIGADAPTFAGALRALLREDPDVVLVGEMRDADTVTSVLRAAETTRLVFTTVHASSAPGAVSRILDLFEPDARQAVRESLAANMVAIVCQKLVTCADPNTARIPTTEVLLPTPSVRKAIRDGADVDLPMLIATDSGGGMHDFTQDLARLVREEWVDPKDAYEAAPNAETLKLAIRGIDVKKGAMR
jgi:twitching motility protein PilT